MELIFVVGAIINLIILLWVLSALGEIRKEARQTRQLLAIIHRTELAEYTNMMMSLAQTSQDKKTREQAARFAAIAQALDTL